MSESTLGPNLRRKLLWPGLGGLALFVWTIYSHATWLQRSGFIHGLLAFFIGLLILILGNALGCLVIGVFKHSWRWLGSREALRMCGWTALFAVSTVVLFYNVELYRGKRAWAAMVQEANARGEPLTFEAVIPPRVPDEQNFAKAPIFAPVFEWNQRAPGFRSEEGEHRLMITNRSDVPYKGWRTKSWPWLDQEKTDLHAWAEFYAGRKLPSFTEESQAARSVLEGLGQYTAQLAQVREFSSRPYCRFPVPYERQLIDPPCHLIALRDVVILLERRASAELVLQESDAALADVQLALRLVEYSRQQPWAWAESSGTRLRLMLAALQPVWEGLAERTWTAQQLADLQKHLLALNVIADYQDQVRADALFMSAFVESLIPTTRSAQPIELGMGPEDRWVLKCVRWIYPVGWSLQDQAAIRRFQFQWADALPVAHGQQPTPQRRRAQPLFESSDPFFPVYVIPKVRQVAEDTGQSFLFAQTLFNQAALACALERYRQDKGMFPGALEALVPRYIDKPPPDLTTGEPLKYRRMAEDRFVLYSVGYNKTDDGGVPCVVQRVNARGERERHFDLDENDWVWASSAPQTRN